ncbi:MAG: DUF2384 domain-containing protein [Magnetospirillum sp.]|nr:DUF2384 domain-containing protein [Magnetospirillum sp.]
MAETQDQMARGVAGAFQILKLWKLTDGEIGGLLGFPFGNQLSEWKAGNLASMPVDVVKRLRLVAGIYKLLRNHPGGAMEWLRQPIPQFGNQMPLARMASGDAGDLLAVHDHLKSRYGAGSPMAR